MHPQLSAAVARARENPGYGFDTLRDELASLPEDALPGLLAFALDPANADVLGQAVAALGDTGWPGAYEAFAGWVVGGDVWIAVDAGCALDAAGGGGFGFWDRIAPGDQPDPEKVASVAPELVAWWRAEGHAAAPDLDTWRASLGRAPTREERIFALVRSTPFAVLSDGRAVETAAPLPPGRCYTGGIAVVEGVGEVKVAFVLDSDADEPITAVMAESRQGWLDIRARVAECRPRHVLGDTDPASLDARYEVGPTGSLRDVGR
ncbi:MAG: hypothetical protein H6737_07150 [Alphaproteobacteria bacterium]|nr:hypothetical protein [Alphaproteobacteria bacterium]